jgi:hypothetical protein
MQDRTGTDSNTQPIPVSPNNPCPFLRAAVSEGYIGGHTVPLATLAQAVQAASGKTGFEKVSVGIKTRLVALVANGLNPLRLLKSWWSGATLDELRDGPLDKHGVGSRILDATAHVHEDEIERLASFGKERPDPMGGGTEIGLTNDEITAYMNANFERAKAHRRVIDRKLMEGEWPVLLDIMGKGEGEARYLSVAEVRTLFTERRLPERINARLSAHPVRKGGVVGKLVKGAAALIALLAAFIVVFAEFPELIRPIPLIGQLEPPALPDRQRLKAAYWLDQNWSTDDRFWFHHASQGTATFPVPYSWFIALEQPGLRLWGRPGMFAYSAYLEKFGFIPSPKTVRTDEATLRRFGFVNSPDAKTEPAPESVGGLKPLPADNIDGLPVGFARLTNVTDPGTGAPASDKIGLTCAACHTGSIYYKGTSVRFDGGGSMLELRKLEAATGLAIVYTLKVPGRFPRFATRVLGPDASGQDRRKLKDELSRIGDFLLAQKKIYDQTVKAKGQAETDEGYGRLDALNRIGNQVFYTDLVTGGLSGMENNLYANDAPVSYPPIWTVPWLWWAQYDGSIEQPLIRNAGEALGVSALLNLSPEHAPEKLFRSSVAVENLVRIEAMLRGSDPFSRNPKSFAGLQSPKWPAHLFPSDDAWKINPDRVAKGRKVYAEICAECHLGPVADREFDAQYPDKSFWTAKQWSQDSRGGWVFDEVQKGALGMGTDLAQASVLRTRMVQVPGFLNLQPAEDLGARWKCKWLPTYSSTEMPFAIALMIVVDKVSQKWLADRGIQEPQLSELWGERSNCPNPKMAKEAIYRARPLNGVWATAPYLHNGSVPSLYWMLNPAAERPRQFCLGAREFDPQQVGFRVPASGESSCKTGQTMFSMTDGGKEIKGNSVLGHSLEAAADADKKTYPNGVIGRKLSEDERYDLIEYLKTL